MKGGNEHKNSIVHWLINPKIKSQQEKEDVRSKSSTHKFQYKLPKSFFNAVDDARVEAGYDILPRFHQLSVSSSPSSSPRGQTPPSSAAHRSKQQQQKQHLHLQGHTQAGHKHAHSSSRSDNDNVSPKKVRFRLSNRKHSRHHRQKGVAKSSSTRSAS